ncbi:hypothetical protein [Pedobacter africanus]|uniref:Uncharacterized protein n=1 Tax=Pedobacter africanus TaxID=151894 RepID=A0A1W1ZD59_9SPHI|nr:hypothetical protein [Pedobacter africanus]SMC45958.1 hypothetical protein SAMN04488524_0583 [Pedobacter africanus]
MKTNDQAKQEAIKAAYGKYYDELKPYIGPDGWINGGDKLYSDYCRKFEDIDFSNPFGNQSWRPIELTNLESNNGWTRIEPDGSNLPACGRFKVCNIDKLDLSEESKLILAQTFSADAVCEYFKYKVITHYKPIVEEPKPIY